MHGCMIEYVVCNHPRADGRIAVYAGGICTEFLQKDGRIGSYITEAEHIGSISRGINGCGRSKTEGAFRQRPPARIRTLGKRGANSKTHSYTPAFIWKESCCN